MKCREFFKAAGSVLLGLGLCCSVAAQWLPDEQGSSGVFVLKGVASYAPNFAADNSKDDLNVDMDLDRVVSAKPKVSFFALCEYDYWPTQKWDAKEQQYVVDKAGNPVWSGEGYLDVWITDMLCYGDGRHSLQTVKAVSPVWNPKAKFGYNGLMLDLDHATWPGPDWWAWSGKGKRAGLGFLEGVQTAGTVKGAVTWVDEIQGALVNLTYKARRVVVKATGEVYHEPTSVVIDLQGVSQTSFFVGAPQNAFGTTLLGIGKVKLTTDTKLTGVLVNQGATELNRQINALLQKGAYPPVANF